MGFRLERNGGDVESPLDAVGMEGRGHRRIQRPAYHVLEHRRAEAAALGPRRHGLDGFPPDQEQPVFFQAPGDAHRAAVGGKGSVFDGIGRQFMGGHAQDLRGLGVEPHCRTLQLDPAAVDRAEAVDLVGEEFAEVDAADSVRQQQVGRTG